MSINTYRPRVDGAGILLVPVGIPILMHDTYMHGVKVSAREAPCLLSFKFVMARLQEMVWFPLDNDNT